MQPLRRETSQAQLSRRAVRADPHALVRARQDQARVGTRERFLLRPAPDHAASGRRDLHRRADLRCARRHEGRLRRRAGNGRGADRDRGRDREPPARRQPRRVLRAQEAEGSRRQEAGRRPAEGRDAARPQRRGGRGRHHHRRLGDAGRRRRCARKAPTSCWCSPSWTGSKARRRISTPRSWRSRRCIRRTNS